MVTSASAKLQHNGVVLYVTCIGITSSKAILYKYYSNPKYNDVLGIAGNQGIVKVMQVS